MKIKIQNNIPLLGSLIIGDRPFTHFKCEIYKNKNEVVNIINKLNKLKYPTLYFDRFHEIINFKKFEENGLLELLKNKCDKEIIFLDNNLAECYVPTGISYHPSPYFLGINVQGERKITNRQFGKHFLCLNYHPKPHREEMYRFFYDNNLFEKTYFSFKPWDTRHPYHMKLDSENITQFETFENTLKPLFEKYEYKTLDEHENSFCSIVTETFFDKLSIKDYHNVTFITEKVEKCISAGQPFIVVSTPGYLRKLKELGFHTFDKWWDESYDDEVDDVKRMYKIKKIILDLSKKSLNTIEHMYIEMHGILKKNQQINREYEELNKLKCHENFNHMNINMHIEELS